MYIVGYSMSHPLVLIVLLKFLESVDSMQVNRQRVAGGGKHRLVIGKSRR